MPLGVEPDGARWTSNKTSNTGEPFMPDFLTRRHGTWQFVRRVPSEFAKYDPRGVIKHSTKIRVAEDRTGRRATKVALRLNAELENFWQHAARGKIEAVRALTMRLIYVGSRCELDALRIN
jgi:hypothetical protein